MTMSEARAILEVVEHARKTIATAGVTPSDWVAERYNVTRGRALSMMTDAARTLEHGATCPTCGGTGRVK